MISTEPRYRILFVAPFPPPVHGSAVVSQHIRDSLLINESFSCDYVNLSTSRNLSEIGGNSLVKCWRFLSSLSLLFWKLIRYRYDLCYLAITCHGRGFLKDAPFVLLCQLFRRKIVIHQHNKGMAHDANRWPYKKLLRRVYKDARVLLLSDKLYPDIASVVPRKNVLICPNGIPFRESMRPIQKADKEEVELLFVSNLIPSKGVFETVEACRLLKEKRLPFRCRIIGDKTQDISPDTLLQKIASAGLNGYVTYAGPLFGEEKDSALLNADVFVFPSYNECLPLCVLEAMRAGLPVVTTDEGGIPDLVEDGINGLICKRKDVDSLAKALEVLIIHPELREHLGKEGRRRFEHAFTQELFEQRFTDCIRQSI